MFWEASGASLPKGTSAGKGVLIRVLLEGCVSFDPILLSSCLSSLGFAVELSKNPPDSQMSIFKSFSMKRGLMITDFLLKTKPRKTACKSYDSWTQPCLAKNQSVDNSRVLYFQ